MFENVLGQPACSQLVKDIQAGVLAPAMLFSGPVASGKGTATLELGRVISCEETGERASWNCGCSACARHRLLLHPDLLCLGRRPFSAEIAASAGAFLRETSVSTHTLFIRSMRKLLARFNPVLWEDDPKGKTISPLVNSIEEDLDELESLTAGFGGASSGQASLTKHVEGMLKSAYKLESEGMGEYIPIAQLRRAAYWGRLAPAGRGKLLLIENADRMQEEARNSLLKLLEEPPSRLTLVLTTTRPGSLLPTMLSRLRPYHFSDRDLEVEQEVIRRVFREQVTVNNEQITGNSENKLQNSIISAYLDSFLPVSALTLEALAAFFAASVAYKAALLSKKQGRVLPEETVCLGKFCAPKAEAAGLGRPQGNLETVVNLILERAEKFEIRSLFFRFLSCLLEQASSSQRLSQRADAFLPGLSYYALWRESVRWADTAVGIYNLRPAQVLEKLFTELSNGLSNGYSNGFSRGMTML